MAVERAAHVTMPVGHTSEDSAFGGAAIGAGVALVSGVGTVPAAAIIGIGWTLGKVRDKGMPKSPECFIARGVESVRVGEERQPAANSDPARADAVGGMHVAPVAAGSHFVFVEKWNFSRKGDQTDRPCGGEIMDGCPTVFVGGEPTRKGIQESSSLAMFVMDNVVLGAIPAMGAGNVAKGLVVAGAVTGAIGHQATSAVVGDVKDSLGVLDAIGKARSDPLGSALGGADSLGGMLTRDGRM